MDRAWSFLFGMAARPCAVGTMHRWQGYERYAEASGHVGTVCVDSSPVVIGRVPDRNARLAHPVGQKSRGMASLHGAAAWQGRPA